MIKLGIFIIPNHQLKTIILKLKKIVKKKFGIQTYLNHLPHCTLYVFETSKKNFKEIKKMRFFKYRGNKSFYAKNTKIFFNDPITKKNTYIISINKNRFLTNLQKKVLEKFSKYAHKKKLKFSNKRMENNYRIFGYPFIKLNWKPHFTIASISPRNSQSYFVKKFKNYKVCYKQSLSNIYVYQIRGNKHNLINKIKI